MIEHSELKRKMFYDGAFLASFYAMYPNMDVVIRDFYEKIVNSALSWFTENIFEREKKRYEESTDTLKRFNAKPARYSLRFEGEMLRDSILQVRQSASLVGADGIELDSYVDSQIWDLSEGHMLTARQALGRVLPNEKKRIKRDDSILFEGNEVFVAIDRAWVKIK